MHTSSAALVRARVQPPAVLTAQQSWQQILACANLISSHRFACLSSVDQRLDNVIAPNRSGGYPPPDLQQFTDSILFSRLSPEDYYSPFIYYARNSASSTMLVSIVFSFRNEESNIRELVRRVDVAMRNIDNARYEIVFVNDDSTDNSASLLLELQKHYPITLINMSRNFGVTPCLIAGFAHTRGDAVVCMDTDLQDPPELLPQLIQSFRDGAEIVHTVRIRRDGESAFKMWLTRKAYRIINFFSDIHLPENCGDFKLYSRRAIQEILRLKEYDPYMRGLAVWVGYRQEFVPYQREPRWEGRTKFPLFSKGPTREFLRGLTGFSAAPLYLSFLIGLVTSLIAAMLVLYAVITKITGAAAPGVSGILIALAFFNGLVLVTNGIIGIYVAKIFDEVRERPKYIIKEILPPTQSAPDSASLL